MYPAIVRVVYFDRDFTNTYKTTNILIYTSGLSDVAMRVEHYFDDVQAVSIHFCGDEGILFEMSDETLNMVNKNESNGSINWKENY